MVSLLVLAAAMAASRSLETTRPKAMGLSGEPCRTPFVRSRVKVSSRNVMVGFLVYRVKRFADIEFGNVHGQSPIGCSSRKASQEEDQLHTLSPPSGPL